LNLKFSLPVISAKNVRNRGPNVKPHSISEVCRVRFAAVGLGDEAFFWGFTIVPE
jgi:hypothetical protein